MADIDIDMSGDNVVLLVAQGDPDLDMIIDGSDHDNMDHMVQDPVEDQYYELQTQQAETLTDEQGNIPDTFIDVSGEQALEVKDDGLGLESDSIEATGFEATTFVFDGHDTGAFQEQDAGQTAEGEDGEGNTLPPKDPKDRAESNLSYDHRENIDPEHHLPLETSEVLDKEPSLTPTIELPQDLRPEGTVISTLTEEVTTRLTPEAREAVGPVAEDEEAVDLDTSPEDHEGTNQDGNSDPPAPVNDEEEENLNETHSGTEDGVFPPASNGEPFADVIRLTYNNEDMSLFPPTKGEDSDTYLLSDMSLSFEPFQTLFVSIREVLAESIDDDTNLELEFPQLGIKVFEASEGTSDITLNQMLELFVKLQANENSVPLAQLDLHLHCHKGLFSVMQSLEELVQEGVKLSGVSPSFGNAIADQEILFHGGPDHDGLVGGSDDALEKENDEIWSQAGHAEDLKELENETKSTALDLDNKSVENAQSDHINAVNLDQGSEEAAATAPIQPSTHKEITSMNATHRKSIIDDDDELIDYSDDDEAGPETTYVNATAILATESSAQEALSGMQADPFLGEMLFGGADSHDLLAVTSPFHQSVTEDLVEAVPETEADEETFAADEHRSSGLGFEENNGQAASLFADEAEEETYDLELAAHTEGNNESALHSNSKPADLHNNAGSPNGSTQLKSNWVPEGHAESLASEAEYLEPQEGEDVDPQSTDHLDQEFIADDAKIESHAEVEEVDGFEEITIPEGLEPNFEDDLESSTSHLLEPGSSTVPKKRALDPELADLETASTQESNGLKRHRPS